MEDNRNFFRNPVNVAKIKNFMVAELATNYPRDIQNNVEGGYFGEFNPDLAFGIYLGKEAVQNAILKSIVTHASNTFLTSKDANPINFFLGGGSDFKWGLDINYAQTNKQMTGGEMKYDGIAASIGIETKGGMQAYLNYNIEDKSEGSLASTTLTASSKIDSTGWQAGLIYDLKDNYTIFAQYSAGSTDIIGTVNGTTGANEQDTGYP